MKYTFTKMDSTGRPSWAAQHPDTTVVGFGRSKLQAARHLEAGRADRRSAIDLFSFVESPSIDIQEPAR